MRPMSDGAKFALFALGCCGLMLGGYFGWLKIFG